MRYRKQTARDDDPEKKLVDWIVERIGSRVPSLDEERDLQRAKGRRVHRDLRGFDKPNNGPEPDDDSFQRAPVEQLYQEGKRWFLDQRVPRPLS